MNVNTVDATFNKSINGKRWIKTISNNNKEPELLINPETEIKLDGLPLPGVAGWTQRVSELDRNAAAAQTPPAPRSHFTADRFIEGFPLGLAVLWAGCHLVI